MGHFDFPGTTREVGNLGEVGPVTGGEHNAVDGQLGSVGQQYPQLTVAGRGGLGQLRFRAIG